MLLASVLFHYLNKVKKNIKNINKYKNEKNDIFLKFIKFSWVWHAGSKLLNENCCFMVVTHPNTEKAHHCLDSVIWREVGLSMKFLNEFVNYKAFISLTRRSQIVLGNLLFISGHSSKYWTVSGLLNLGHQTKKNVALNIWEVFLKYSLDLLQGHLLIIESLNRSWLNCDYSVSVYKLIHHHDGWLVGFMAWKHLLPIVMRKSVFFCFK